MEILIIDNNRTDSERLKLNLTPGLAAIHFAHKCNEALTMINEYRPDIILLDYSTMDMDILQGIKAIRTISTIPILILSIPNTPEILVKALEAGADDFLMKPISQRELIAHINTLVRRFHGMRSEQLPLKAPYQSAIG